MPNQLYKQLIDLVATYVGTEKAPGIVERQMKYCTATSEAFTQEDLKKIQMYVIGAAKLYLMEKDRLEEMRTKVATLAGG